MCHPEFNLSGLLTKIAPSPCPLPRVAGKGVLFFLVVVAGFASGELSAPIVADTKLNREAIAARLDRGYLDATTLMEHLILRGVPQRTAHEIIGRLVATATQRGVALAGLSLWLVPGVSLFA